MTSVESGSRSLAQITHGPSLRNVFREESQIVPAIGNYGAARPISNSADFVPDNVFNRQTRRAGGVAVYTGPLVPELLGRSGSVFEQYQRIQPAVPVDQLLDAVNQRWALNPRPVPLPVPRPARFERRSVSPSLIRRGGLRERSGCHRVLKCQRRGHDLSRPHLV